MDTRPDSGRVEPLLPELAELIFGPTKFKWSWKAIFGIGGDDVARGISRSLDDLNSLRGASMREMEDLIPSNFVRNATRKDDGIRFADPARRGDQIRLMPGNPSAIDPLHQGPYAVISRGGTVTRVPLQGNPTLP